MHDALRLLVRWVSGSAYLRFFHKTIVGPYPVYIEVAITLLVLLLATRFRPKVWSGGWFRRLAQQRALACLIVFCLSIGGRLLLLTIEPFPEPAIHDEFSYLLAGDTLAHGRLSNPILPYWHHFEPFHVLMEPTYSSMYSPGFPLFLAFGERFFGSPRAGVLLCAALAAASLCWMLQALVPATWAFAGGLLAVVRINWFSYFGNTYWGGSAGILAGCLVLGAATRLLRSKKPARSDAILLAFGVVLLLMTRPYEGLALSIPVLLGVLWKLGQQRRLTLSLILPAALVMAIGASWIGYYCYRVTGHLQLPQSLQRAQWAEAPPLIVLPPDYSHAYQFKDQVGLYIDYEMAQTYLREKSFRGYISQLPEKIFREWHFYVAPALTLTLIGFIPTFRSKRYRIPAIAFSAVCAALLTETWVQPQYLAVAAGFLYLVMVNGVRWLRIVARRHPLAATALYGTCAAVVLTTVLRLFIVPTNAWPPSWSSQNNEIPAYAAIHKAIESLPGKQLVFVRYGPGHYWYNSWINNGYDVPSQKVIWARDTEPSESNDDLICAFPDRQVLLLKTPEDGYQPPPDQTASGTFAVSQFIEPYPAASPQRCPAPDINSGVGRPSPDGLAGKPVSLLQTTPHQ